MARSRIPAILLSGACLMSRAQDPAVTDPDKYVVLLENARTRVLDYRDHPGDRTHPHRHPDSILYALSAFTRRLHFLDGHSTTRTFKVGEVLFIPGQVHIGENVGTTDTHVLLVEFKEPPLPEAAPAPTLAPALAPPPTLPPPAPKPPQP